MSKVRISHAAKLIGKSKHTLYRDIEKGLVSCEMDGRGFKVIDVSELERFYGPLATPDENERETVADETADPSLPDTPQRHETLDVGGVPAREVIDLLKDQVAGQQIQLEHATEQISQSAAREAELLQLLSAEQEKNKLLMLPAPRPKVFGWLERFGFFRRHANSERLAPQDEG